MNFKTLAAKHNILSEALSDYTALETELATVKAERDAIRAELEQLGQAVAEEGYDVTKTAEGVYVVTKTPVEELPEGDYLHPITYTEGMTVVTGKWYTDGEDIWDASKDGVPTGFDDAEYFNIITL